VLPAQLPEDLRGGDAGAERTGLLPALPAAVLRLPARVHPAGGGPAAARRGRRQPDVHPAGPQAVRAGAVPADDLHRVPRHPPEPLPAGGGTRLPGAVPSAAAGGRQMRGGVRQAALFSCGAGAAEHHAAEGTAGGPQGSGVPDRVDHRGLHQGRSDQPAGADGGLLVVAAGGDGVGRVRGAGGGERGDVRELCSLGERELQDTFVEGTLGNTAQLQEERHQEVTLPSSFIFLL
jgi:hypothetical protein